MHESIVQNALFRAMTKGILRCLAAVSRSTFVFIAGTTLIM